MPYLKTKYINGAVSPMNWTEQAKMYPKWYNQATMYPKWNNQATMYPVKPYGGFTGFKYNYIPNSSKPVTTQSNLANYDDPLEINSMTDVIFGTFNKHMKHAGNNEFIKAPIINIIPNTLWHMYSHYIKPIQEGHPSEAVVNALTVEIQEDVDFVDNVIKAVTTPLTNKETTIMDIIPNLGKATFFGGEAGRVNFDYDVDIGNAYANNLINGSLEIITGLIPQAIAAFFTGGMSLVGSAVSVGSEGLKKASKETVQALTKKQIATAALLKNTDAFSKVLLKATGGMVGAYGVGFAGGKIGSLFGDEGEIIGQTLGSFLGQQGLGGLASALPISNMGNKYISNIYSKNMQSEYFKDPRLKQLMKNEEVVQVIKDVNTKYQKINQQAYETYKNDLGNLGVNKQQVTQNYYKQLDTINKNFKTDIVKTVGSTNYFSGLTPEKIQYISTRFSNATDRMLNAINANYKYNLDTKILNSLGFKVESMYNKGDALPLRALPYLVKQGGGYVLDKTNLSLWLSGIKNMLVKNENSAINPKTFLDMYSVSGEVQLVDTMLQAVKYYHPESYADNIIKELRYDILHKQAREKIKEIQTDIEQIIGTEYSESDIQNLELKIKRLIDIFDETQNIDTIEDYIQSLNNIKREVIANELTKADDLDFQETINKFHDLKTILEKMHNVSRKQTYKNNHEKYIIDLNIINENKLNAEMTLKQLYDKIEQTHIKVALEALNAQLKLFLNNHKQSQLDKIIELYRNLDIRKSIPNSFKKSKFYPRLNALLKEFKIIKNQPITKYDVAIISEILDCYSGVMSYQTYLDLKNKLIEGDKTYVKQITDELQKQTDLDGAKDTAKFIEYYLQDIAKEEYEKDNTKTIDIVSQKTLNSLKSEVLKTPNKLVEDSVVYKNLVKHKNIYDLNVNKINQLNKDINYINESLKMFKVYNPLDVLKNIQLEQISSFDIEKTISNLVDLGKELSADGKYFENFKALSEYKPIDESLYDTLKEALEIQREAVNRFIIIVNHIYNTQTKSDLENLDEPILINYIHELISLQDVIANKRRFLDKELKKEAYKNLDIPEEAMIQDILNINLRSVIRKQLDIGEADSVAILKYENWYVENQLLRTASLEKIFSTPEYLELIKSFPNLTFNSTNKIEYTFLRELYKTYHTRGNFIKLYDTVMNYVEKDINRKETASMFLSVMKQYAPISIHDIKTNQNEIEKSVFTSLDRLMWNADRDFKRQNMEALRKQYDITDDKVNAELIKAGITEDVGAHEALFDVAAQIMVTKAMKNLDHFDGLMLDIETSGTDIFNSRTTEITAMTEVTYINEVTGNLETKLVKVFSAKISGDKKFLQDYKPDDTVLNSMHQNQHQWITKHTSETNYSEADLLADFYMTLLKTENKNNITLTTFNGECFDINFLKQRFRITEADKVLKYNSEFAKLIQIYFPKTLTKEPTFEAILEDFAGHVDIYKDLDKNIKHLDMQSTFELKDIFEEYTQNLFNLEQHLYNLNENKVYDNIKFMEPLDNDTFNKIYHYSKILSGSANQLTKEDLNIEYKTEGNFKFDLVNDIQNVKQERIQIFTDVKAFNYTEQSNKIIPVKDGFIETVDGHKHTINQLILRGDSLMLGYNIFNIESYKALFDLKEIVYYKSYLQRLKNMQRDILKIRDSIKNTLGISEEHLIVKRLLQDIKNADTFYEASVIKISEDFKTNFAFLKYVLNIMEHSKNPRVNITYETIKTEYGDYLERINEIEYKVNYDNIFINPDSSDIEYIDHNPSFPGMHYDNNTASEYFKEVSATYNSVNYSLDLLQRSAENSNLNTLKETSKPYQSAANILMDLQKDYKESFGKKGEFTAAAFEKHKTYSILNDIVAQFQLKQLLQLNPMELLGYTLHSGPDHFVTFNVASEDYFNNKQLLKEFLSNKKVLKEHYIKVTELDDGRIKLEVDADAPIIRKTKGRMTHYDDKGELIVRSNYSLNNEDLNYILFREINETDLNNLFKALQPDIYENQKQMIAQWYQLRHRLIEMCPELSGRTGTLYSYKTVEKTRKNSHLDIKPLEEEYDNSYYFNDYNIGSSSSQKEINDRTSGNQLTLLGIAGTKMLRGTHSYFEYGKYILEGGPRLQDPMFTQMPNEALRNYLNNGDYVIAYLTPNKNAIGGFMLRKLNSLSDKLLDIARQNNAVILDYKTYEIAFEKINKFSLSGDNKLFKAWKWYIQNLKRLYLINTGVLNRNIIDSSLKNMNDFDESSELFKYTVKSSKLLMQYTTDLRQIRQMDPYLRYTLENAEKYFNNPNTYKAQLDKDTYSMIYDFLTNNGNNSINTGVHDTFDALMLPNRFFEDTIRFAQYIKMLEQGHSENHIFKEIAERHFNYDIKEFLGNAEWGAKLSYIIPFFNFATKNIQYSLKLISENPKLFKQIINYYGVMWQSEEYSQEELEENTSLQYQIINGNIPLKYLNPYWQDQQITRTVETKYGPKEQDATNTAVLKMGFSLFDAISFFINPLGNIKEKLAPPLQVALNSITEYNKYPFNNVVAGKYSSYEDTQEYYRTNFGASSIYSLLDADNPNLVKEWLQLLPGGSIAIKNMFTNKKLLERTNNPALANMSSIFGATVRWGEFKQEPRKTYSYPTRTYSSAPRSVRYYSYNYNRSYPTSYRINHKGQSVKYYLRYPQKTYYTGKIPYTAYSNMLRRIYSPNTAHRFASNNISSNMQTIPQYLYSYYGKNRQGKSKILSWMRMNPRYKVKSTLRRIASP